MTTLLSGALVVIISASVIAFVTVSASVASVLGRTAGVDRVFVTGSWAVMGLVGVIGVVPVSGARSRNGSSLGTGVASGSGVGSSTGATSTGMVIVTASVMT